MSLAVQQVLPSRPMEITARSRSAPDWSDPLISVLSSFQMSAGLEIELDLVASIVVFLRLQPSSRAPAQLGTSEIGHREVAPCQVGVPKDRADELAIGDVQAGELRSVRLTPLNCIPRIRGAVKSKMPGITWSNLVLILEPQACRIESAPVASHKVKSAPSSVAEPSFARFRFALVKSTSARLDRREKSAVEVGLGEAHPWR